MGTTQLIDIGSNSAFIEYSPIPDALVWETDFYPLIQSFLTSHGWTFVADGPVFGYDTGKIFSSPTVDGGIKYIFIGEKNDYLNVVPFETWDGTNGTNQADLTSSTITTYSHRLTSSNTGKLYLFATNRWFFIFNYGNYIGASNGSCTGCVEFQKVYSPEDDTPNFGFFNSFLASGYGGFTDYGKVFCPCRTLRGTGATASEPTKLVTPMGEWGYKTGYRYLQSLSQNAVYFSSEIKYPIFDMTLVTDVAYPEMLLRGKLFGLKTFPSLGANTNEYLFTAKCDSSFFLDDSGTNKDFFIVDCNHLPIGIPV